MRKIYLQNLILLSLLTGCTVFSPGQTRRSLPSCASQLSQAGERKIAPADLAVGSGHSTAVISSAQKFIIPVPEFGEQGDRLVYPPGHPQAGQPILNYEGKPIGDRGIVFFNGKDQSWQAAEGNGEAVIIINQVTANQATQLYEKIQADAPDPNNLTLAQLKEILTFAQKELGLVDMYNSDRSFIREHMTPVNAGEKPTVNGSEIEAYGFKKRDDRDINQAIYIPGKFVFQGPAATPQEFDNGGVIVVQDDKMRGVQPDIFVNTYTLSDGRKIQSVTTDLAAQCD